MKSNNRYLIYNTYTHSQGYYTGKEYVFQGERFAVFENDVKEAKTYKTKKIAEKVANNVYARALNMGQYEIKNLDLEVNDVEENN